MFYFLRRRRGAAQHSASMAHTHIYTHMRLPALLCAVACDISFACNVLSICKLFSSHLSVSPLCFCCCYAFRLFSVSPMEIGKKFNWVINELQANFNAQFHCYPLPHAVAATTLGTERRATPAACTIDFVTAKRTSHTYTCIHTYICSANAIASWALWQFVARCRFVASCNAG